MKFYLTRHPHESGDFIPGKLEIPSQAENDEEGSFLADTSYRKIIYT